MPAVHAYFSARWANSALLSEVDDAIQEVFVACFREHGVLTKVDSRHPSGFRALLFSVTRNIALHLERTRQRRVARIRDGVVDPDRTPAAMTLSRHFDRSYAQSIMSMARERMQLAAQDDASRRRVEILRLRFEDGLAIRQIAELWMTAADAIHRDYARARQEFRAALSETVLESEGCSPEHLQEECQRLLRMLRN